MEGEHWRMVVHNMLRAGFGVQDISVKLQQMKMPWWGERSIREEISHLRSTGKLMDVLALNRRKSGQLRSVSGDEDHREHGAPEEGDQVGGVT